MNLTDDLRIERVELEGFRSYDHYELCPSPSLTVIVGPNASGKTNLLEAIRLTTSGTSFRRPKWEDVIKRGAERAAVSMHASSAESVYDVRLTIEGTTRHLTSNGKQVRRRAEMAKRLPSVVFTPEDLSLLKGAAEERRNAIDDLGESLSTAYGSLCRDYGRIVRQRNALLKEENFSALDLEPWSEQLAEAGAKLATHRVSLLRKVARQAEDVYAEVSGGETLSIRYTDSYDLGQERWLEEPAAEEVAAAIHRTLARRGQEERNRRATLAGPHRDDVSFEISGEDARTHASQGQQRTAALAWKIAELRIVHAVTGRRPVLLLDDVMSELDESRRAALTRYVGEGLQTLITATTLDYFSRELLSEATIVHTGAGS